jgi:hypothetical protein
MRCRVNFQASKRHKLRTDIKCELALASVSVTVRAWALSYGSLSRGIGAILATSSA